MRSTVSYFREFILLTFLRVTSYINNLHPKETVLYGLVERLIDASLPLWGLSLAPLVKLRQDGKAEDSVMTRIMKLSRNENDQKDLRRIPLQRIEYDPDPYMWPYTEGPQQQEGESENKYGERRDQWVRTTQKLVYPEPNTFTQPIEHEPVNLREYAQDGLQIIVKLANIELTPDKPVYEGGSWHVEGQLVCALFLPILEINILMINTERTHCCDFTLLLLL